jgi:hypothetical protein
VDPIACGRSLHVPLAPEPIITVQLTTQHFLLINEAISEIEGNVEYRFDIYKAIKGGLFVDAGNMWLIKNDDLAPGWNNLMSTNFTKN